MNTLLVVQADAVAAQPWRNGGGQTRELLAWPDATDWKLRISRADIASDGPFSAFAGVQRWFVVLSGKGVRLRMPLPDGHTREHQLRPGHAPLHFDGALAPLCLLEDGPTQDLNLMARGGQACMQAVDPAQAWHSSHRLCGLYTATPGRWSCGLDARQLIAHTLLWCAQGRSTPMRFAPHDDQPAQAWWLGYTPETFA